MFKAQFVDKSGNRKVECLKCGKRLWHSYTRKHILSDHKDFLPEYDSLTKKILSDGKLKPMPPPPEPAPSDAAAGAGDDQSAPSPVHAGSAEGETGATAAAAAPPPPAASPAPKRVKTAGASASSKHRGGSVAAMEVDKLIAQWLIAGKHSFEIVDDPTFRNLIIGAIRYGARLSDLQPPKYTMPGSKLMQEYVVEGQEGLLLETIEKVYTRMKQASNTSGSVLLLDTARDATGRAVEMLVLQSAQNQSLVWVGAPREGQNWYDWLRDALTVIFNGSLAFSERQNAPSKHSRFEMACYSFLRFFELAPTTIAIGCRDNSNNIKLCQEFERDFGTLTFTCPKEEFIKCFARIYALPELQNQVIGRIFEVYEAINDIPQLSELLLKRSEKTLVRPTLKRPITLVLACERILNTKACLQSLIKGPEAEELGKDPALKVKLDKAAAVLADETFWSLLGFTQSLSTGLVTAMRFLDVPRTASVCLVYKLWSIIAGSAAQALTSDVAPQGLAESVRTIILTTWEESSHPIFSAGYILAPQYHEQIQELHRLDPTLVSALIDDAAFCCAQVFRRFDEEGRPRLVIHPATDPVVIAKKAFFVKEIQQYIALRAPFDVAQISDANLEHAPNDWWDFIAHFSPLRHYASKITSLSASVSTCSRFAQTLTTVNPGQAVGFSNELGKSFIASEVIGRTLKAENSISWKTISQIKDVLETPFAEEAAFVESLLAAENRRISRGEPDTPEEEALAEAAKAKVFMPAKIRVARSKLI